MENKIVAVDSGTIIICDPCYLKKFGLDWNKFLEAYYEQKSSESNQILLDGEYGTGLIIDTDDGEYSKDQILNLIKTKIK